MSADVNEDGECVICGSIRKPVHEGEEIEPHLDWCDADEDAE